MSGLIDPTTRILMNALDGLAGRQSIISANLANIDTPGYTAKSLDFETAMQHELASIQSSPGNALGPSGSPSADVAMKATDSRHFSAVGNAGNGSSATVAPTNESIRNDGNKVDLETEMTALTQTQIKFAADSRLISGKFAQLTTVLGGR
jgi:flagellar basal-body rod protein FlgB